MELDQIYAACQSVGIDELMTERILETHEKIGNSLMRTIFEHGGDMETYVLVKAQIIKRIMA